MRTRTMAAWALMLGALLSGCRDNPSPHDSAPTAQIDGARARSLLLGKYRQLFAGKYFRVDDSYHAFPLLSEADFTDAMVEGDAWAVRCEPLAGHYVVGRVAKDGSWVDLERVGFANQ